MEDFFEIDFLDVQSKKSGDAIPIRYRIDGQTRIHITDGGFQDTGDSIIEHISNHYGSPEVIDAIVVTHQDQDHTGGLRKLFGEYKIGELWMLRPWLYAEDLIDRFSRYTSAENLATRLKEIYPNIAALEQLAEDYGVPILEPFQGASIGDFKVLAPSKDTYLDLVVESDKTPEATKEEQKSLAESSGKFISSAINFLRAAWGEEIFPEDDTSAENNMSVIQYANLCDSRILLTGDAGRSALSEAADYAPFVGLTLPGVDRIQVPHHGSRHNVSSDVLDRWLGTKLGSMPESSNFSAIVSASKEDKDHPRRSVVRAFIHRGAQVVTTENGSKCTSFNAPEREGWRTAEPVPYPDDQEE